MFYKSRDNTTLSKLFFITFSQQDVDKVRTICRKVWCIKKRKRASVYHDINKFTENKEYMRIKELLLL